MTILMFLKYYILCPQIYASLVLCPMVDANPESLSSMDLALSLVLTC